MIVIPMAGLSSRFFKAGYDKPKYMLEAFGVPLFDYAVKSFENYFDSEKFVFILRNVENSADFIRERVEQLGINNYEIVILEATTRGQAETVALGLSKYRDSIESITIFNIDTFRPGFVHPNLSEYGDGYLEVFKGTGENWSFVRPKATNSTLIDLTTEKMPISDFCCTGLYHFKTCTDFFESYEAYLKKPSHEWVNGEIYIAPLYNFLIKSNKEIHYNLINKSDVIFCGTPKEYDDFLLCKGL